MFNARMVFEKTGKAALISHLDLMKCFQRAFIRAGLDVKYSQGFNPHIYLSIMLPLSLGYEGENEIADFDIMDDELPEGALSRLNEALPEGLAVKKLGKADTPISAVAFSRFEVIFRKVDITVPDIDAFLKISVEKRSKRGMKTVVIGDYIKSLSFEKRGEDTVCIMTLVSGEEQLNPAAVGSILKDKGEIPQDTVIKYKRIGLFDKNMSLFF